MSEFIGICKISIVSKCQCTLYIIKYQRLSILPRGSSCCRITDMSYPDITDDNYDEIVGRMDRYMEEFRQSGVDKLVLED